MHENKMILLGHIELDRNALHHLSHEDIISALYHHSIGDWGAISESRRRKNQKAVLEKRVVRSMYYTMIGTKIHVATVGDRSHTKMTLQ
jgi:hypothetical protein